MRETRSAVPFRLYSAGEARKALQTQFTATRTGYIAVDSRRLFARL